MKGKAHVFGKNINTDYIIAGKYKFKSLDMKDLSTHLMEDLRPGFYKEIEQGDFIVAGENFGMGSSREQAPLVHPGGRMLGGHRQVVRPHLLPQLHQRRPAGHRVRHLADRRGRRAEGRPGERHRQNLTKGKEIKRPRCRRSW